MKGTEVDNGKTKLAVIFDYMGVYDDEHDIFMKINMVDTTTNDN